MSEQEREQQAEHNQGTSRKARQESGERRARPRPRPVAPPRRGGEAAMHPRPGRLFDALSDAQGTDLSAWSDELLVWPPLEPPVDGAQVGQARGAAGVSAAAAARDEAAGVSAAAAGEDAAAVGEDAAALPAETRVVVEAPLRRYNALVAGCFREAAARLERSGENNPYRVAAYRRGARVVERLGEDVGVVYRARGEEGLRAIRWIGESLASTIRELIETGRWAQLEQLREDQDPARVFEVIPGIGPDLARRIHDTLQVTSLEALEQAARRGQLERVSGIGSQRAYALSLMLAGVLRRAEALTPPGEGAPPVALLFAVDRRFRYELERRPKLAANDDAAGVAAQVDGAQADGAQVDGAQVDGAQVDGAQVDGAQADGAQPFHIELEHHGFRFRARQGDEAALGERAPVEIDFEGRDHQATVLVVTETRGSLAGHRVIRERELESQHHYERQQVGAERKVAT